MRTEPNSRGPVVRFIEDYRARHSYWPNALLHVIGIPLTIGALYLAWRQQWLAAAGALVGGYLLQSLGHRLQGSEVGEMALIRRLVGKRRSAGPT
jgi:hypothetical protein